VILSRIFTKKITQRDKEHKEGKKIVVRRLNVGLYDKITDKTPFTIY